MANLKKYIMNPHHLMFFKTFFTFIKYSVSILFLISVIHCASKVPYQLSASKPNTPVTQPKPSIDNKLYVTFTSSENQQIDLSQYSDVPVILIFGDQFCDACTEETKSIKSVLSDPTREPSKVKIVTLLVGAYAEDAADWKDMKEVPWTVGTDFDASLFAKFCDFKLGVPCIIVNTPEKGVVLLKQGSVSTNDLKQLTGAWE